MVVRPLDPPKVQVQRKPFATSKYREDARDNPNPGDGRWKEQDEGSRHHRHYGGPTHNWGSISGIEALVRALASASSEQQRWQKLIERFHALAGELGVDREQVYYMALAGFIEKYEEALREHAGEPLTESSYGELYEYTIEEFKAILEADRLEPDPAEGHKGLVED